ncbi:MAG: hypothetical protein PHV06_11845, partial [bacterium]|nr:hypothetical protein [bacterium]
METKDFTGIYKPLVDKISRQLGLIFIPLNVPEGNVCFMSNSGLRPEFKTTFTQLDVINFVYAVLYSSSSREESRNFEKIDLSQIRCPEDLETFWELVRKGAGL